MRELVFVVNSASGGRRGVALLARLRERYGAGRAEAFDPARLDALIGRCRGEGAAAVACGGDGTVAAVLDAAHRAGGDVPVGVLPLGTGNDLARALGWAASGQCDPEPLRTAPERRIDRWRLRGPVDRPWFNYLSIGYDARIASRFHTLRRHHPSLFLTPLMNKALYGVVTLADVALPLGGALRLTGPAPMALPAWTAALVLANVPSYAGGVRLGSAIAADDGRLDAFALPAGLSLGLALGGVRAARRLGAHRRLEFTVSRPLPLQVDGEPLLAPAGRFEVAQDGIVTLLAPSAAVSAPETK